MLKAFGQAVKASRKYRSRFGLVQGFLLWIRLRRHVRAERGTLHEVRVPGLEHSMFLRAGTSDVLVFIQIFIDGELGFDIASLPQSIVDAGANIGLASVYFAHRFPHAQIVALEIDQANFDLLIKNTAAYPNIKCVKNALWSGAAQLDILNPTDEPWAYRVGEVKGDRKTSIKAVGVAELMQQFDGQRIDLLKIDIEGAEKEVFQKGAAGWIGHVGMIAVELHDHIVPGCSAALDGALASQRHRKTRSGEYTIIYLQS